MRILKIVRAIGELLVLLEKNHFGALALIALVAITAVASIAAAS